MLEQLNKIEQELNKVKKRLALFHLPGKHDQKAHGYKRAGTVGQTSSSLSATPVKTTSSLGGGVNGSYIVELEDGTKAVFKPIKEESIGLADEVGGSGTLADREVLAYELDKEFFGYNIVPETVMRKVEYVSRLENKVEDRGSLQKWSNGEKPPFIDTGQVANKDELFLFDVVIGNRDRHDGNLLVNNNRYVAIDNGISIKEQKQFGYHFTSRERLGGTDRQIDRHLIDKLDKIDRTKYKAAVEKPLGSVVADNALNRLNEVVRIGRESATWAEFIDKYDKVRLSE